MCDPAAQNEPLHDRLMLAAERVLRSGRFIGGQELERFEQRFAARLGTRHAVGCSSGSDALWLALRALDVGPSDEVITTPFTFVSTVTAILRAGARPVFADLEAESYNLDPASVAKRLTPRTKAIVAVHLFGEPARMDELALIARDHDVALIEDAAQAFGARSAGGASLGTLGTAGCFSFFPSKILGGFGDGGCVVTGDSQLAARLQRLRAHGADRAHEHEELGWNCRLDALQAALLDVKLDGAERWIARRREHALAYDAALSGLPGLRRRPQSEGAAFGVYTIEVLAGRQRRDALVSELSGVGVDVAVYYSRPVYRQPALRSHAPTQALPHVEAACDRVLSLPLYPELSPAQRERVCDAVAGFLERHA